jgi:hypothetical protein
LVSQAKLGLWENICTTTVQLESDQDFGVMVNESGKTKTDYGLKAIDTIMEIETYLVANPQSLDDREKALRIKELQFALEWRYMELEKEMRGVETISTVNDIEAEQNIPIGRRL